MSGKEFLEKVKQDAELQAQFQALIKQKDQKGIVALAQEKGFNCNYKEIYEVLIKLDEQELQLLGGTQSSSTQSEGDGFFYFDDQDVGLVPGYNDS